MSDPYRGDGRVEELQEKVVKLDKENRELRVYCESKLKLAFVAALIAVVLPSAVIGAVTGSIFARQGREAPAQVKGAHSARQARHALPAKSSFRYVREVSAEDEYRECVERNLYSRKSFLASDFLELEARVDDNFTYKNEEEYVFCAMAGDRVVFEMKATMGSGIDSELFLASDSGEELASDDNSGGGKDAALAFSFERSGRYILRCEVDWMLFWNNHAGEYSLIARRIE